nr:hypothetical protein [Tanacetum cinerariifolium]
MALIPYIPQMESSATREYPSLTHTIFLTHTIGGVFLNRSRLQHPLGCALTNDAIMAIIREGKQRGHILGVGRVLPGQDTVIPPPPPCTHSFDLESHPEYDGGSESGGYGDDEPRDDEDGGEDGEDEDDS